MRLADRVCLTARVNDPRIHMVMVLLTTKQVVPTVAPRDPLILGVPASRPDVVHPIRIFSMERRGILISNVDLIPMDSLHHLLDLVRRQMRARTCLHLLPGPISNIGPAQAVGLDSDSPLHRAPAAAHSLPLVPWRPRPARRPSGPEVPILPAPATIRT